MRGLVVGTLALLAVAALAQGQPLPTAAKLPGPRTGASAAWVAGGGCDGGCVYLLGGFDGQAASDRILRYDPATNQTRMEDARLPQGRYLAASAQAAGAVYVIGGWHHGGTAYDSILRYDPLSGTLETARGRLPEPRFSASAAAVDGQVYVFGGRAPARDSVLRYDPTSDSVHPVADRLPSPRWGTAAAAVGNRVYVLGGFDGARYLDEIVRIEIGGPPPEVLPLRLPEPRAHASVVARGETLFLAGGHDGQEPLRTVLQIDVGAGTVVPLAAELPQPRLDMAGAAGPDAFFLLGGTAGDRPSDDVFWVPMPRPAGPTTTADPRDDARTSPTVQWPLGVWGALAGGALLLLVATVLWASRRRPEAPARRARPAVPSLLQGRAAQPGSGPPLVLDRFVVERKGQRIIDGISLLVPPATLVILLGESGSGKSTLLRAVIGLERFQGERRIFGEGGDAPLKQVGFVPQDLQLYDQLSVLDNLAYFGGQHGLGRAEVERRAARLLEQLGLDHKTDRPVALMSGGERRRVSIAVALVHDPKLLVLDEPTSGLDFASRRLLWGTLQELARHRRIAVIASTHFLDDVPYADRVGILHDGRLVAYAAPSELAATLPGAGEVLSLSLPQLRADDRPKVARLLAQAQAEGLVAYGEARPFHVRALAREPAKALERLAQRLAAHGWTPTQARLEPATLEDVFIYYRRKERRP